VARIELAPGMFDDFDRILEHLAQFESPAVSTRIDEIMRAIDVLASNPLIGRPTATSMRELLIGRDAAGYVALYRYVDALDIVLVLALWSQREAGYAH